MYINCVSYKTIKYCINVCLVCILSTTKRNNQHNQRDQHNQHKGHNKHNGHHKRRALTTTQQQSHKRFRKTLPLSWQTTQQN